MEIKTRLIDQGTLKPNPDAGSMAPFLVPGHSYTDEAGVQHRPVSRIFPLSPQSAYLFQYEPMTVTCVGCKRSFDVTELTTDVMPDDEGWEDYDDHVCPHCQTWNCLGYRIQLETLGEALKRQESERKVSDG